MDDNPPYTANIWEFVFGEIHFPGCWKERIKPLACWLQVPIVTPLASRVRRAAIIHFPRVNHQLRINVMEKIQLQGTIHGKSPYFKGKDLVSSQDFMKTPVIHCQFICSQSIQKDPASSGMLNILNRIWSFVTLCYIEIAELAMKHLFEKSWYFP